MSTQVPHIDDVIAIAHKAGAAILELYKTDTNIQEKADNTRVTDADLAAEKIILDELKQFGIPILSEESEDDLVRLESDLVWIVDPLDGTNDFIDETDEFAVMIGLAKNGVPELGVVYQAALGITYCATRGQGAFKLVGTDEPIQLAITIVTELPQACAVISRTHLDPKDKAFLLDQGVDHISAAGSTGVKIGTIASGNCDLYITSTDRTKQWDTCAPECIITEAGGLLTDYAGDSYTYNTKDIANRHGIVVANPQLHSKLIAALNYEKSA